MNNNSLNLGTYLFGTESGGVPLEITVALDAVSVTYAAVGIFGALVLALIIFGILFRK